MQAHMQCCDLLGIMLTSLQRATPCPVLCSRVDQPFATAATCQAHLSTHSCQLLNASPKASVGQDSASRFARPEFELHTAVIWQIIMQLLVTLACLIAFIAARCLLLLLFKTKYRSKAGRVKTMIVLGSGGHTAEMLMLVSSLDKQYYSPRVYVVAETDKMSAKRALTREQEWAAAAQAQLSSSSQHSDQPHKQNKAAKAAAASTQVSVEVIPRSREVGQSYVTSVFTTLYSLLCAFWMVTRHRPQLVLVNGPGTCIPVCAAAWVNRVLLWFDSRVIYVESIARVRKLSLSGTILYHTRMADKFLVQWPELQQRFPRSTYSGRLY